LNEPLPGYAGTRSVPGPFGTSTLILAAPPKAAIMKDVTLKAAPPKTTTTNSAQGEDHDLYSPVSSLLTECTEPLQGHSVI